MTAKAMPHHLDSQRWEIGTSPGVWLTQCLMRTQESINPAVTKGAGKEQWQAKHMSSERVMAKWLPPHTRYLNSLSNWFLFRQLILQQDKVSRGWGPAGNEDCHVKTHKQSCTSKEEDKSKQFPYFKKKWRWDKMYSTILYSDALLTCVYKHDLYTSPQLSVIGPTKEVKVMRAMPQSHASLCGNSSEFLEHKSKSMFIEDRHHKCLWKKNWVKCLFSIRFCNCNNSNIH